MKPIFISMFAAASLAAVAAPAFAAPGQSINVQQSSVEQRIDRGVHNGSLTRREAVGLRAEARQIARLEARYRSDGLSRWERRDLQTRLSQLSVRIGHDRHDREARNDRHSFRH